MNIEVKDSQDELIEKICNVTDLNPSELMKYLMDFLQTTYFDYKREKNVGVEKGTFKDFLTNLSFDLSNLRTIEKRLIEATNELLGIKEYIDAGVYNIDLDFYDRSFCYTIGYELCVDVANMDSYKGLLINVEINQDYIDVSHVFYLPRVDTRSYSALNFIFRSFLFLSLLKASRILDKSSYTLDEGFPFVFDPENGGKQEDIQFYRFQPCRWINGRVSHYISINTPCFLQAFYCFVKIYQFGRPN
jgi:hypothetical protein